VQNLTIMNKYQEELAAILFPPPAEGGHMMVICHGFRGTKANGGKICAFAAQLQSQGMGVLAFDFSGSGSSQGDFVNTTLSRQASDLQTVVDYVHTEYSRPIILLGRSFGGSTVLAGCARDNRIAGYVLWSVPAHLEPTFKSLLPDSYRLLQAGMTIAIKDEAGEYLLHPNLISDFDRHDVAGYLQGIQSRPVLIVQASDDEVVAPANAFYLWDRLKCCSLFMVDQAGHRFHDKTSLRESITLQWLRTTFK
jgi:alpha/beta superfamily hydrolase